MTNLDHQDTQSVRKNAKRKSNKTPRLNRESGNEKTNRDGTITDAPRNANQEGASEPISIDVEGLSDQDGNKMFRVTKGAHIAEALVQDLVSNPTEVWKALAQQGVALASSSARTHIMKLVDGLTAFPKAVYVARTPGFHADAFVMPDGSVVGKPTVPDFRVRLKDDAVVLGQAGSLQGWQTSFRKMLRDQPIFMLAVCCGFAGLILRLSPYPKNVGFELY